MKKLLMMITALIYCGTVQATLINVDWGKNTPVYTGAAATGLAGDFWNSTDPETNNFADLENVLDSLGTATTVDVTWTDELQSSSNPGAIEFGTSGPDGVNLNDLMEDYAFTHPGTTATVTLSQLPANTDYTLYLYGVPDGQSQDTTFAVTGANEGAQTVIAGNVNDDNGLNNPDDYVVFTGNTGAGGQIVYTQTGSSFSGSNGFQLQYGSAGYPRKAHTPTPVMDNDNDNANNVDPSNPRPTPLSWRSPLEDATGIPLPSGEVDPHIVAVTGYDVYIYSIAMADIANGIVADEANFAANPNLAVTPDLATTSMLAELETDTVYYWRVDTDIEWDSVEVTGSINSTVEGTTWRFETKFNCTNPPEGDITGPNGVPDCVVNLYDFAELASVWMVDNRI